VRVDRAYRTFDAATAPVRALRGASLVVDAGEFVAITGPSGCGKSTLLNLVAGLDVPDEGEVELAGLDLTRLGSDDLAEVRRRHVGIVFQFFNLLDGMTALENVLVPMLIGRRRRRQAEIRARDVLGLLGIADKADQLPAALSGGQRQRLAIARALLSDPPILILDEATSALDAESERLVQEAIDRLLEGRTVFVIAHRLSTIQHADRILVLEGGRLVEEGTHAALLLRGGAYARLHAMQFDRRGDADAGSMATPSLAQGD
jgi:putative ABC transport system ATP-binding protein